MVLSSVLVGPPLELFHLELLRNLRQRTGRFEYVLKGGTNLRFFHGSVSYSQDANMDILSGSPDHVRDEVSRALGATALRKTLAAHDIASVDHVMFEEYRAQVVAFLEDGYAEQYDDRRQVGAYQLSVIEALEGLLR